MSESGGRRQLRETLAPMLWIGAWAAAVGGWLWATQGVEAESPPLYNSLRVFLLVGMLGVVVAGQILTALDTHGTKVAGRAADALARVTDQPQTPRNRPRPIITAMMGPLLGTFLILNLTPDLLALLQQGEVARTAVAGASLLAGSGMMLWVLVDRVCEELRERRRPPAG